MTSPAFAGYEPLFSRDGHLLLTAGYDGTLQLWKVRGTRAFFLDAFQLTSSSKKKNVVDVRWAFSPDGTKLAIGSADGRLQVWNLRSLVRIYVTTIEAGNFGQIEFDDQSHSIYFEVNTGTFIANLISGTKRRSNISLPFVSVPKTSRVVTEDGLFDSETDRYVRKWMSPISNTTPVSVSPDGKYAVVGSEDPLWYPPATASSEASYARTQNLRTWRLSDGKLVKTMPGFTTLGGESRVLYWKSRRDLAAPGLGESRNIVTGDKTDSIPEKIGKSRLANQVWSFTQGVPTLITFPGVGTQTSQIRISPIHGLGLIESVKALSRQPYYGFLGDRYFGWFRGNDSVDRVHGQVPVYVNKLQVEEGQSPTVEETYFKQTSTSLVLFQLSFKIAKGAAAWRILRTTYSKGEKTVAETTVYDRGLVDEYMRKTGDGSSTLGLALVSERYSVLIDGRDLHHMRCIEASSGKTLWVSALKAENFVPSTLSLAGGKVAVEAVDFVNRKSQILIFNAQDGSQTTFKAVPEFSVMALSPDGGKLACVCPTVKGWFDLETRLFHFWTGGPPLLGYGNEPPSVDWDSKGSRFIIGSSSSPIEFYDPSKSEIIGELTLYSDRSWLAESSEGAVWGTAHRLSLAKKWTGSRWKPAVRKRGLARLLLGK